MEPNDLDTDGLSIGADALVLNGGSIRDLGGMDARLDLGTLITDRANLRVDGRIDNPPELRLSVRGFAVSDDTLGRGARILMSVFSSEPVTVTGDPTIALTIGDQTRQMTLYDFVAYDEYYGSSVLYFSYDVQASDLDDDGLSVAADALALNGGSIRDASGNDAILDFGRYAITNDARLVVNGGLDVSPVARSIVIGRGRFFAPPRAGEVYRLDDVIEAYVFFDKGLEVIGSPSLAIDIGGQTRQMTYDGHYPSGTGLRFRYTVQALDRDLDGIGVGPNALTLNGGAIRDAQGHDANLSLTNAAASTAWVNYKVDGSQTGGTGPG